MKERTPTRPSRAEFHVAGLHVGIPRWTIPLCLAIAGALIVVACGSNAPASPAPSASKPAGSPSTSPAASAKPSESAAAKPKQLVKVRAGDRPFVSSMPLHIARDEGFFAAEGLDVTLTMFATGADNTAAVMAGECDLTASNDESSLNLVGRGADLKAILTTSIVAKGAKSSGVAIRKQLYDSGLTKPTDLKGRSIAWIGGWSLLPYALQQSMEAAGIDTNKELNRQVIRDTNAVIAALQNGAIDSAMFTEPSLTKSVSQGVGVPLLYIDQPEGLPLANLAFRASWMKDNKETVLAFMRAYIKAEQAYMQAKSDPTKKKIYAEKYGKQYNLTVDDMTKVDWSALSVDGSFNRKAAEEWMNWVAENGGVQKKVTFEQWWDPSWMEQLKKDGFLK